jgi:hypothetical protein
VTRRARHNPGDADQVDQAVEKYREFHRFDPKKVVGAPHLVVPQRVRRAGAATWVTYRSGKVDPGTMEKPKRTFDYIHEHDAGVVVYVTDARGGELDTEVPAWAKGVDAVVQLGKCLGFSYVDAMGKAREAKGTPPLPDLCCTPDGRCLLVVQDRKTVLAMMWGGALGVFARGIDG